MGPVAQLGAKPAASPAAGAPARSARLLVGAIAAAVTLSLVAGTHVSRPDAASADIHVRADGDVAVVLCVVDEDKRGRCLGKDTVLAGTLDGTVPALCGMAARPLASPCPAGRDCAFRRAAPSGPIGLIVLEPRPPSFGVPRHRLVDAAVLAPDAAPGAAEIAASVRALTRCFAPAETKGSTVGVARPRQACEERACRLERSSIRVVQRERPAR